MTIKTILKVVGALTLCACAEGEQLGPVQFLEPSEPATVPSLDRQPPAATEVADALEDGEITVWVQDHEDVDKAEVLKGCNMWSEVGLFCSYADKAETSTILVEVSEEECVPDENGSKTLAWGGFNDGWGSILLIPTCFQRDDEGALVQGGLAQVAGHETGHTLGTKHVAEHCDDRDEDNPVFDDIDGKPVCGRPALMNPFLSDIPKTVIHLLDLRAFSVRHEQGVYQPDTSVEKSRAHVETCALGTR